LKENKIPKKLGKLFSALAGIFTLVYILLGVITGFTIIFETGLIALTLWLIVIIDIDTLLKKRKDIK
jgi:hypothetical protein